MRLRSGISKQNEVLKIGVPFNYEMFGFIFGWKRYLYFAFFYFYTILFVLNAYILFNVRFSSTLQIAKYNCFIIFVFELFVFYWLSFVWIMNCWLQYMRPLLIGPEVRPIAIAFIIKNSLIFRLFRMFTSDTFTNGFHLFVRFFV